jgi:hypothetical protein
MKKFNEFLKEEVRKGDTFVWGATRWNVEKADQMIKDNPKKFEKVKVDLPELKRLMKFIRINTDYVKGTDDKKMNEPGIMISSPELNIVGLPIDGWHRAKARLNKKKKFMTFYMIKDPADLKEIRLR